MTEREIRDAARAKLDQAISDYHKALWEENPDVMMVGGWVIAIHGANVNDRSDSYLIESAPGQPWHASVGLVNYARTYYEDPKHDA